MSVDGARAPVAIEPAATRDPNAPRVIDFGELTPGETLVAEATCANCFNTLELAWTVDDSFDTTPPSFMDAPATTYVSVNSNSPRTWGVSVCLPALDPFEPVVHQLDYDTVRETKITLSGSGRCLIGREEEEVAGEFFYLVVAATDDVDDEVCFIGSAIDVAGLSAVLPQTCVPLVSTEEFSGCSQTSPPALFAFALALLLPLGRRRSTPS